MDLADALGLGDVELVAFVGAGGKKTAMAHLVERARERGLAAGYTTTTKMPPPELPLVIAPGDRLPGTLDSRDPPVAFAATRVADPDRATEKVEGYPPGVLDDLFGTGRLDWLLVKADGARRREFKAPGPEEPVVPTTATHVVPVASIQAAGRSLDAPAVHRPERVAAITGDAVGDPVTPGTIGTVLASEAGGLAGVPSTVPVTPVVNKADTPELREPAREAIDVALGESDRLQTGVVTSFEAGYCEVREDG